MKKIALLFSILISISGQSQIITTVAGNGTAGSCCDSWQATAAELANPAGIMIDAAGNLYIADQSNQCIRMVNSAGIISAFAGNGTSGYSGDGGQATAAELYIPAAVAIDAFGNYYIADFYNQRIRMVNTAGIINTVVGNGTAGFSGDGGSATAAKLNDPIGLTFDAAGNMYIADLSNNRIRMVNTAGIINTVAGNGTVGFSGDGGNASAAKLNNPVGVAFDAAGNMYIADNSNNRIRMVNSAGIINTVVGNGTVGFSGDGGNATAAELNNPSGIAFDAVGNLYIADYYNHCIRMVNTAGIISTIAGNGTQGYSGDGGNATAAELYNPDGVAFDAVGNLYIADYLNNRIRKVCNNSCAVAGIAEFANNNEQLNIYPNPSNNVLNVEYLMANENTTLVMHDMLGNAVYHSTLTNQHSTLSVADLEAGIYFVTLTSGTTTTTQKVVVSK